MIRRIIMMCVCVAASCVLHAQIDKEMEEFDKEYSQIDLMGHRADPFTESQIDK